MTFVLKYRHRTLTAAFPGLRANKWWLWRTFADQESQADGNTRPICVFSQTIKQREGRNTRIADQLLSYSALKVFTHHFSLLIAISVYATKKPSILRPVRPLESIGTVYPLLIHAFDDTLIQQSVGRFSQFAE